MVGDVLQKDAPISSAIVDNVLFPEVRAKFVQFIVATIVLYLAVHIDLQMLYYCMQAMTCLIADMYKLKYKEAVTAFANQVIIVMILCMPVIMLIIEDQLTYQQKLPSP